LEAATPGTSLPSKQELLAFQSTWIKRAGVAALVGAFLVIASFPLQRAGLHPPSGNSDANQLVFEHAHASRLIYSSVMQGLGFVLFAGPLLLLFRSAAARAQRVRQMFGALILIGPIFFGIGSAVLAVGETKAADSFVNQEPAAVQRARQQAEQAQAAQAKAPAKGKAEAAGTTTAAKPPAATAAATTTAPTGSTTINLNGTTTTVATPVTPDQAGSNARENLADHLGTHTTLRIIGGITATIGTLALVFGLIYTGLWAMRTGLLTRLMGTVAMFVGASLVVLGLIGAGLIALWFAVLGLMFLGLWPRPLPPAWAAGEAVPWQRRGDDLGPPTSERGPSGTVEGSGREVSEQPLPENGQTDEPPEPPYGETQGQRRKKRKRRN
jgi:uncharacterized membrane protein